MPTLHRAIKKFHYSVLILGSVLSGAALQAQISAENLASAIAGQTGKNRENFVQYSEGLAALLNRLSPAQRKEVVGMTGGGGSSNLNEELELEPMLFDPFSSALKEATMQELDKVGTYLADNPDVSIVIEGHVQMDFALAQDLSEMRAENARDYLASLGIDPARIEAVGFGAEQMGEGSGGENRRINIVTKEK